MLSFLTEAIYSYSPAPNFALIMPVKGFKVLLDFKIMQILFKRK